jgi:hypothetical protein
MHVVDLTGKTDQEMIDIITNAGKTAERWEEARENLLIKPYESKEKRKLKRKDKDDFRVSKKYDKPWKKDKKEKSFKNKKGSNSPNNLEGISEKELTRRRKDKECLRCAWPADRKGIFFSRDCLRPIKTDEGTASFPKPKEYQKMRIGALELESGEEDEYSLDSESEELRDTASDNSDTSGSSEKPESSSNSSSSEEEESSLSEDWWN